MVTYPTRGHGRTSSTPTQQHTQDHCRHSLGSIRRVAALVALVAFSASPLEAGKGNESARDILAASDDAFELPGTRDPSQVLPAELLRGPHHHIGEKVVTDGYLDRFVIATNFGDFRVHGRAMLDLRLHEIAAIAELDEQSKTKVFIDAAARSAVAPIKATVNVVKNPVKTVKGVPAGVGRLFGRVKRLAQKAGSAAADAVSGDDDGGKENPTTGDVVTSAALDFSGVTGAHRRWARKLGVDPYSSNKILNDRISAFAKVDRAASLATILVSPLRGGALSHTTKVNDLVWSKDPGELEQINQKRLKEIGAGKKVRKRFLKGSLLTPTQQTYIVSSLSRMAGVSGRESVAAVAAGARTEEEAWFFVRVATRLALLHQTEPIARLRADGRILLAETKDGRGLTVAPFDRLYWSRNAALFVADSHERHGGRKSAARRELRTNAQVSARARRELESRGWSVGPLPLE